MPSTPIRQQTLRPTSIFSGVALETRLKGGRRIASIDLLRGVAAVLMTIDHAQLYFGTAAATSDLRTDSTGLFLTSLLTGIAAPAYFLLAGLGVFFRLASGQSKQAVAVFLITRGILLIVLDLTVVPLIVWFNYDPHYLTTGPLWAIGWSMIALSGLLYFRVGTVAGIGMAIVFLHNLLDGVHSNDLGIFGGVWIFLHELGTVRLLPDTVLNITWPVLPWIGVIACGYGIGELYRLPDEMRPTLLLAMGGNLLVSFFVLRGLNFYGDPVRWTIEETRWETAMSFLNCTREPASLCYLLLWGGPVLVLLGLFDRGVSGRWQRLAIIGSVPLYFYFMHLLVLHLLAMGISLMRSLPIGWLVHLPDPATGRGTGWQPEYGIELTLVYVVSLLAIVVLYPGCQRYAKLKFLGRPGWASYF